MNFSNGIFSAKNKIKSVFSANVKYLDKNEILDKLPKFWHPLPTASVESKKKKKKCWFLFQTKMSFNMRIEDVFIVHRFYTRNISLMLTKKKKNKI